MKTIVFCMLVILFLIGCVSIQTEEEQISNSIDEFKNSLKINRQKTKIPSNKISEIKGKKGSRIKIDPSKLEHPKGDKLLDELEVVLVEVTTKAEFFKEDLPTITNDKILESGGMFYLEINSGGTKLKLKKGEYLDAEFPKLNNGPMNIYYAELENEKVINWLNSDIESKIQKEYKEQQVVEKIVKKKSKGDIGKILDYIDNEASEEEKKEENTRLRIEKKVSRIYRDSKVSQLGWINIDRLIKEEEVTPIICNIKNEEINYLELSIFFKKRNVYLKKGLNKGDDKIQILPIGEKLIVIGTSIKDGKLLTDKKEFTVEKDLVVDFSLSETSEKQLKDLLNKI